MIALSFGYVKPTSTTVGTCATNNVNTNPSTSYWVQSVLFQAIETNTGIVYICTTPNPNFTTGIGVWAKVPVPDASGKTSIPAWVIGDPSRNNNPVNVAQFFIIPAVSGEGVLISAERSGTQQASLT